MRQLIAEKLGCKKEELEQKNIIVTSAGIAAAPGCGPSPEAVDVVKEKGLDLTNHASQPLTEKLVRHADLILTMTTGHRHAILRRWPDAEERIHNVRSDGGDINDPIGGSASVYRECADEVENALRERIQNIDFC